jgi:two-component system cell cycle sensor histidine kinase/response regulator CckA
MGSARDIIQPRASGRPQTIFLVEDDLALAALTATWLRAFNFEVIVSNDGREAAALAPRLTAPIDVLLTDVMLTGMRGPALAEVVRASHPQIAVLFTSGYSAELVSEAFASHADTELLLRKPYTADQLASSIRLALVRGTAGSHSGPAGSRPELVADPIAASRT